MFGFPRPPRLSEWPPSQDGQIYGIVAACLLVAMQHEEAYCSLTACVGAEAFCSILERAYTGPRAEVATGTDDHDHDDKEDGGGGSDNKQDDNDGDGDGNWVPG